MSQNPYAVGGKDARDNKGPQNLSNAPAQTRQNYDAGYAHEKKKQS